MKQLSWYGVGENIGGGEVILPAWDRAAAEVPDERKGWTTRTLDQAKRTHSLRAVNERQRARLADLPVAGR